MPYILRTHHLTKTIGGKNIVEDVNLHVKEGEIYGFLDQGILMEQIRRDDLQEKCSNYIEIRVSDPERYCVLLDRRLRGQKYQVRPDRAVWILQPEESADMARRSVALNDLTDSVSIVSGDIMAGMLRFCESVIIAVAIAAGYILSALLLGGLIR